MFSMDVLDGTEFINNADAGWVDSKDFLATMVRTPPNKQLGETSCSEIS